MKTLKVLFIAIMAAVAALSLSNCKKDSKYTVKGRVVFSCDDNRPVKNTDVFLYNDHKGLSNTCNSGEIARTTTDENGNFVLTYDKSCGSGTVSLNYDLGYTDNKLVDGMEANKDYDLGDVYDAKNGFYVARIKTAKPYTNKDTLYFGIKQVQIRDSASKILVGPFADGQVVDTVQLSVIRMEGNKNPNAYLSWMLKSDSVLAGSRSGESFYVEQCKRYSEFVVDFDK